MRAFIKSWWVILIVVVTIMSGCKLHLPGHSHPQSVQERFEHTVSAPDTTLSSAAYVEGEQTLVSGVEDRPPFYVLQRTSAIKKYPCAECHTKPLAQLQANRPADKKKAHWDIELVHAKESVMTCATCHGGDNFNMLRSLTGAEIDFSHSYQLCAQCHSRQYDDWVGGAHGKRVGGWARPRVVKLCVECHPSHQPGWEKRWPARLNTASK